MTKYILHGGFTSIPNELNKSFYAECTKGIKDNGTILLVYFAREDEEMSRLFEEDRSLLLKETNVKDLNIILAEKDKFLEQLEKADAIYMRGGSTIKLLETLKQYPDIKNKFKDKIISGSSAGAYVLSTYFHSASEGGVLKGLEILPIRIICHFQSDRFKERGDPIVDLEKYPNNLELVILKDCEWKTFEI